MNTLPMPLLAAVVAVATGTACAPSTNQARAARLGGVLERSTVSLADTVSLAQLETVDGIGVKAALLDEPEPVFAVAAVTTEEAFKDVRIDGRTAEVISLRDLTGTVTPCRDAVPLIEAIQLAEGELAGNAVTIQPDDDGQCNRELEVLSNGSVWSVKIAPDGALLQTEEDDDVD